MVSYSVLMSVYSKERSEYLRESIQSIFNQTVKTDDFVIVCDGPLTPDLDNLLNEFSLKYPHIISLVRLEKNAGLGNALNVGMSHCKNELIARMDSDDIAFQTRCEIQLKCFEENQNLDIVSASLLEFDNSIKNITAIKSLPETNDEIYRYARRRCPFNHPTVMYKKSSVLQAGGYKDFPLFEDYYLWVRMLNNNVTACNIKQPLLYMRAGENMYRRRGGTKYLKKMWAFRKYLYKSGFCSKFDYFYTVAAQTAICLVPDNLRACLYQKLLRKGVYKGNNIGNCPD